MDATQPWWAEGLLFENCNCQVICPAHISFRQNCTHERCLGHWTIRFDDGRFGETPLGGVNVVVLYDAPQQMFAGDWAQAIYVDESASAAQRLAVEEILTGRAGGPWAVLARFVSRRFETRYVPIVIEDHGRTKRVRVEGILDGTVEALRGKDRDREVVLENMFNQIHPAMQYVARGNTTFADRGRAFENEGTHALYSRFSWKGP